MNLEIEELQLRIEGVDPEDAAQLARAIVARVGEQLSQGSMPTAERATLRVTVDQPDGDLVGPVADAITRQLQGTSREER
jgi:hypothetical protein